MSAWGNSWGGSWGNSWGATTTSAPNPIPRISPLRRGIPITENGVMTLAFASWAQQITALGILTGAGSPEGVVEAGRKSLYLDTSGVLYIKRDADIGGDRKKGWIAK